jgi:tRNA threonylcarbamoyladenosine biosynthesis protein TsaE
VNEAAENQAIEYTSRSAEQTVRLGRALAALMKGGDVVAMIGQLGAGKTQLTRGLAGGLGVDPRRVSSPTFVLMSEYPGRLPVVHIDAYRMAGLGDLESIGWSDELFDGSVTLVEWADRIADQLPADRLEITLEHAGESERLIRLTPRGEWIKRRDKLAMAVASLDVVYSCPTCKTVVSTDNPAFPFCTPRCKMAELNKWFKGDYGIARSITEEDTDVV